MRQKKPWNWPDGCLTLDTRHPTPLCPRRRFRSRSGRAPRRARGLFGAICRDGLRKSRKFIQRRKQREAVALAERRSSRKTHGAISLRSGADACAREKNGGCIADMLRRRIGNADGKFRRSVRRTNRFRAERKQRLRLRPALHSIWLRADICRVGQRSKKSVEPPCQSTGKIARAVEIVPSRVAVLVAG